MTCLPRFTPRGSVRHRRYPDDVDVRIGVTQAPREINLELADDADREDLKQRIQAALSGASDVLAITDKRGNETFVPSAKIAYAELGSQEGSRSIGFGG